VVGMLVIPTLLWMRISRMEIWDLTSVFNTVLDC
jgi:hypothetical protein